MGSEGSHGVDVEREAWGPQGICCLHFGVWKLSLFMYGTSEQLDCKRTVLEGQCTRSAMAWICCHGQTSLMSTDDMELRSSLAK